MTNLWVVFVGLISIVLILIGATGFYLWFKIHSERTIGVLLLAINLGIYLAFLLLIRTG